MNDLGDKYIVSSFLNCAEPIVLTACQMPFGCFTSDEPFVLVDEMIITPFRNDRIFSSLAGDL